MVSGLDRREGVQLDAGVSKLTNPLTIQQGAVQGPSGSSFARVGETERQLGQALGGFGSGLARYAEKLQKEGELEGAMMRAAGDSLEDVRKKGGLYAERGWRALDLKVAGDTLLADEMANIKNTGRTIAPEIYQREHLAERMKELRKNSNNDPDAAAMLDSYAMEAFPKLAAAQARAHAEYNREQMLDTSRKALVSSANLDEPATTASLVGALQGSLASDDFGKVVSSALQDDLKIGSNKLLSALRGVYKPKQAPTTSKRSLAPVLDLIGQAESSNNYNAIWGGEEPNLTKMTVGDVMKMQRERIASGAKSAAAGKYQFIADTLERTVQSAGIPTDALFDADTQDALALHLLKTDANADAFLAGSMSSDEFQGRIANIWAGIPKDKSGRGVYDGDGLNKATVEPGLVQSALGGATEGAELYTALSELGLPSDDITQVMSSYDGYRREQSAKFDADRIITEKAIVEYAANADDASVIERINKAKDEGMYSEEWAQRTYNSALAARRESDREREKIARVETLRATNRVALGSQDEQQRAIDMTEKDALRIYPEALDPEHPNHGAGRRKAQQHVYQFMYRNQVKDPRITKQWELATSGDILDASGKVRPDAIEAYMSYRQAKQAVNDPTWANTLLSDKTSDLFVLADAKLSGDDELSAQNALAVANTILASQDPKRGAVVPQWATGSAWEATGAATKVREALADAAIPGILDGTFLGYSRGTAEMRWSINNDAVAKAVQSPEVQMRAKHEVAKLWSAYKHYDDPQAAQELVVAKAVTKVVQNSEYVAGSFVFTGEGDNLSKRMGLAGLKNGANMVVSRVLADVGEHVWKDFNKTDVFAYSQQWYEKDPGVAKLVTGVKSAAETVINEPGKLASNISDTVFNKARGIPDFAVMFNPRGNTLVVEPYTNFDRTRRGMPLPMSVEDLKQAADMLTKGDDVGYNKWLENYKASLPRYAN